MKHRLSILLLAFMLPLTVAASPAKPGKSTYKITIQIDNATDSVLLLGYYHTQNRYIMDTAYNNGRGKFVFEGTSELYPGLYFFTNNNDRLTEFIVYREKPFFTLHTDNYAWTMHMKAKGSQQNEIFFAYQKESETVYQEMDKVKPTLDSAAFVAYQRQQHLRIDSIKQAYIDKYPDAMFTKMMVATKNVDGGGGRGQLEDAVVVGLGGDGDAGRGRGGAHQDLHAPVLQGVVGVDGLLGVVLVVLPVEGHLGGAGSVDLVDGDLGAILGGRAVDGCSSGNGADATDLEGVGRNLGATAIGGTTATGKGSRSRNSARELDEAAT